jgi:hypothetical protein
MARLQDGTRIYGTANVDTALNVNTYFTANASQVKIGSPLSSNGSTGTAGQILVSGGANNAYWGSTTPLYNYSAQFNGSNQYLRLSNSAFAFVGNNFTAEAWVYLKAMPTTDNWSGGTWSQTFVVAECGTAGQADGCAFIIAQTRLIFMSSDAQYVSSSHGMTTNTWYHLAYVRNGNTIYFYVNGVSVGSVAFSGNIGTGAFTFIGSETGEGAYLNGFISNLRLVNGTAVYTSAFTPPTSPLTAISGTTLLTCNALTLTDASAIASVITNNGGVVASATTYPTSFPQSAVYVPTTALTAIRQQFTGDGSTTQFNISGGYTPNTISVFVNGVLARNGSDVTVTSGSFITFTGITPPNGSLIDVTGTVPTSYSAITPQAYSVSFNGSSQYLTFPAGSAFAYGTGDFTFEGWFNVTSVPDATNGAQIWSQAVSGTNYLLIGISASRSIGFTFGTSGGGTGINSAAGAFAFNTWFHAAVVRSSSTVTVYVNGISVASGSCAQNFTDTTYVPTLARYTPSIATACIYNGYISNFRVVKGTGVYTGAFTPPQNQLTAVQLAVAPSIQAITGTQTSLLTCNAPTIIDGSTNALTITNNGSTPVSTAVYPTFTNIVMNSTSADAYNSSTGNLGILFNNTTNRQLLNAYGFQFKDDGGIITPTNKTKVSFYNEAANTWTVPTGVTRIFVKMWGAGGGGGSYGGWRQGAQGGAGGFSHAMFNVIPGEVIQIRPGGRGTDRPGATTAYPDGGGASTGGGDNQYCANGGGSSSIRIPSISATVYSLYAGGGGGGAACNGFAVNNGGAGGGLIGQPGGRSGNYTTTQYGLGGTQSAGGAGGTGAYTNGAAGTAGQGGTHPNTNCYGGGGGGGYYGGGSGAYNNSNSMGGGGGGSGYVHPSAIFGATYTGSYRTPANSQDSDLQPDNALQYGHGGDESAQGGPGVVVFYY